jgi:hypothetical protein
MHLFLSSDGATLGTRLALAEAKDLLNKHLAENPTTQPLESQASALAARDFPVKEVPSFVKAVCTWGNYAGIAARVLKNNSTKEIASAFRDALKLMSESPNSQALALTRINQVHGLGTPSFGSKHLRFLKPEHCPVFDSVLQRVLPYSFDAAGYALFAQDCIRISAALEARGSASATHRALGRWYAADVEGAIYIHALRMRGAA